MCDLISRESTGKIMGIIAEEDGKKEGEND